MLQRAALLALLAAGASLAAASGGQPLYLLLDRRGNAVGGHHG